MPTEKQHLVTSALGKNARDDPSKDLLHRALGKRGMIGKYAGRKASACRPRLTLAQLGGEDEEN
jgi:hypothetical protein